MLTLAILLLAQQSQPLEGLGSPYYATAKTLTANTTACVPTSTASSTCLLFPAEFALPSENAKKFVQISGGDTATNCCFTLDDGGLDIGATLSISDPPTYSGQGTGCFRVQANQVIEYKPNAFDLELTYLNRRAPGSTLGFCSQQWGGASAGGDQLFAPCDIDADCNSFGGGTCTAFGSLSERQRQYAGARLFCESTATPTIYATKMREKYTR